MSSKLAKLKEINAQKKALAEQQKALREQLDATKDQRKEARKVQAEARKAVRDQKAALRDLSASIYEVFSKGDVAAVHKLADQISEAGAALAATVRNFAEAGEKIDGVVDEDEVESADVEAETESEDDL